METDVQLEISDMTHKRYDMKANLHKASIYKVAKGYSSLRLIKMSVRKKMLDFVQRK